MLKREGDMLWVGFPLDSNGKITSSDRAKGLTTPSADKNLTHGFAREYISGVPTAAGERTIVVSVQAYSKP